MLVNRFGCRIVSIVGSVIAGVFFIISQFSPNIDVLILTYGVMGGQRAREPLTSSPDYDLLSILDFVSVLPERRSLPYVRKSQLICRQTAIQHNTFLVSSRTG